MLRYSLLWCFIYINFRTFTFKNYSNIYQTFIRIAIGIFLDSLGSFKDWKFRRLRWNLNLIYRDSQNARVTIFFFKNSWQWEILKNLWQWEILMIVWQCMSPFARKYSNPLWVRVQKEIHDFMGMGNLSWFYRCFPGVFELSQLSHKSHGIQYFVFRLSPQKRCSTYHLLFTLQRDLFRHS